jgi:hypothetical protein
MQANDFVYQQTYKGCLDAGVKPGVAADFAATASERFKKGKYTGKPKALMDEMIRQAKGAGR